MPAAALLAAYDAAALCERPTLQDPSFDLPAAFAAADRLRQRRIARGEQPLGYKIGFTNRSIWPRYGVHQPIWGPVWDSTHRTAGRRRDARPLHGLCSRGWSPRWCSALRAPHAPA